MSLFIWLVGSEIETCSGEVFCSGNGQVWLFLSSVSRTQRGGGQRLGERDVVWRWCILQLRSCGKTGLGNFPDRFPCFILASSDAFSSPNPSERESSVTVQRSGMTKLVTQSEAGERRAEWDQAAGERGRLGALRFLSARRLRASDAHNFSRSVCWFVTEIGVGITVLVCGNGRKYLLIVLSWRLSLRSFLTLKSHSCACPLCLWAP